MRRFVKGENYDGVNWDHYRAVRAEREKRNSGELEDMRTKQIEIGVPGINTVEYDSKKATK